MPTLEDVDKAIRNMPIAKQVETSFSSDRRSVNIIMTTDHIRYSISADVRGTTYLGAIATSLAPKGGGNDLWDGALDDEVLANMCWDIECYDALSSGRPVSDPSLPNRWAGAQPLR